MARIAREARLHRIGIFGRQCACLVERRELGGLEPKSDRAEILLVLLFGARAVYHRADAGLLIHPCQRDLRDCTSAFLRDVLDGFERLVIALVGEPIPHIHLGQPAVLGRPLTRTILAGQKSAAERTPRNYADALRSGIAA